MNRTLLMSIVLGAVNSACLGSAEAPERAEREVPATPAQVETVDPLPPDHPSVAGLDVLSRGPRRMSVGQLERSIEAFGDLEPGSVVIPEDLALTLGRPDYLQNTEQNLEPTPLFMKFMMDLGGIICGNLAAGDEARPVEQRVFTRYVDREDNLRHALLVMTGIEGERADPYVERLERVFEAGRRGAQGDVSGYEAVCIALFTSPEFLLY